MSDMHIKLKLYHHSIKTKLTNNHLLTCSSETIESRCRSDEPLGDRMDLRNIHVSPGSKVPGRPTVSFHSAEQLTGQFPHFTHSIIHAAAI